MSECRGVKGSMLNVVLVIEIKTKLASGVTIEEIVEDLGFCWGLINDIKQGRTWNNVKIGTSNYRAV